MEPAQYQLIALVQALWHMSHGVQIESFPAHMWGMCTKRKACGDNLLQLSAESVNQFDEFN